VAAVKHCEFSANIGLGEDMDRNICTHGVSFGCSSGTGTERVCSRVWIILHLPNETKKSI
jgi:hypothetical protein